MMPEIFEHGVNTRALFTIEINDEGGYFAIRTESPSFCMHGKTIMEACRKAVKALAFYRDNKLGDV